MFQLIAKATIIFEIESECRTSILFLFPCMSRTRIAVAVAFVLTAHAWASTPDADFAAAERLFRLDNYAKARPFWTRAEQAFAARHDEVKATYARVSSLRGDSETILSYPAVSQEMARILETPLVQTNPKLRLRCLLVKGAADLSSKDPQSSGQVFDEALRVAASLNDRFWIGRISGELGITAFLKGDTAKAVELNARAFAIAKSLNDVQGEVRAKSLDGVGLLEQQRFDDALIRFNEALNFARADPDVRFPLMAYVGKSEALQAQGNQRESDALLEQALKYVEASNMQVYKADLLLELAGRSIKQKRVAAAESLLQQAAAASKNAGMPRPYAQAQLLMTQVYMAAGDFIRAESSINECITASRKLVDMYFLPQHLALAAEIETHLNHIPQADQDYEEAENLIEAMLLNVPSASVKASLIATMDAVFRGHFKLALEHENQLGTAFRIVERVRGRVVADNLRARPQGAESGDRLRVYQSCSVRRTSWNAGNSRTGFSVLKKSSTPPLSPKAASDFRSTANPWIWLPFIMSSNQAKLCSNT